MCVFLSNVKPTLRETFELAGVIEKLGEDAVFGTTHEAVEVAETLSYSQRAKKNAMPVSVTVSLLTN